MNYLKAYYFLYIIVFLIKNNCIIILINNYKSIKEQIM